MRKTEYSLAGLVFIISAAIFFFNAAYADEPKKPSPCPEWLTHPPRPPTVMSHRVRWLASAATNAKRRGRFQESLAYLLELHDLDNSDPMTHTQLAVLYRQMGDHNRAFKHFEVAMALEGPTARGLMNVAQAALSVGNFNHAIATLNRAVELFPQDIKLVSLRTKVLLAQGLLPQAFQSAQQYLAIAPRDAAAHGQMARVLFAQRHYRDALASVSDELRLNPLDPQAMTIKVQILLQLKRFEEALKAADEKLTQFPNDSIGLGLKARALLGLGLPDQALEIAQTKLALNPRDLWALGAMTKALLALNRDNEALQILDHHLTIDPKSDFAIGLKAETLIRLKKFDLALALAQKLNHAFYRPYYIANAKMGLGQFAEAEEILKRMPQERAILWKRAHIAFSQGSYHAARARLLEILRMSTSGHDFWCLVALVKVEKEGGLSRHAELDAALQSLAQMQRKEVLQWNDRLNWESMAGHSQDRETDQLH